MKNATNTTVKEKKAIEEDGEMDQDPRFYEITYLIKPGIEGDNLAKIVEEIRSIVLDLKGIVLEDGQPRLKQLAYQINKFSEANIGRIKFLLKPEQLSTIKNKLSKKEEIIRMSIMKVSKEKEGRARKKPMQASKPTEKSEVKTEEIDKKLEELLG